MHKVISTALLLAAGTALANAASVYSDITSTESENLVAAWNFNSGTSATDGTAKDTWSWTTDFSVSGGSAAVKGSSSRPNRLDNTNGIGISANSFTVSFDVQSVAFGGNWKTLFSLTTGETGDYDQTITLTVDGNGNLVVALKPGGDGTDAFGNASVSGFITLGSRSDLLPNSTDWKTITFTMGLDDSNTQKLTVYVNGENKGSIAFASNDSKVTGIGFGATPNGDSAITSANIDNLAIWNTALTAEQVAALPEPSSFGLLAGLGALALVAARRRRGRKAA